MTLGMGARFIARKERKPPTKRQIEKRAEEICCRMLGPLCWEGLCGHCLQTAELELYREMFA